MKFKIQNIEFIEFKKKFNLRRLKQIFFLLSLIYFFVYFLKNFNQISFNLDYDRSNYKIIISLLSCIFSIFLNALAWQNIIKWFGKYNKSNNLVSFYVLTNSLKYVPGGVWHFVERFNYLKNITNPQLALYSILVEPYFMLCASFFLASIGIIFSPLYLLLFIPIFFLNKKFIYLILKILENLKGKAFHTLKKTNSNYQLEQRIKINYFFPLKAFLFEISFVLTKFFGFIICLNIFESFSNKEILLLLVTFCISWAIGLIVPTAPGGVGVFEACFLFLIGKNIPQNIIFVSLIYFRLISTGADLLLSFPFLIRKFLGRI